MKNKIQASSGIGFNSMLTILFVGLKLGGVIDWSWWWVLSPIWIMTLLVSVVFITTFAIVTLFDKY
jgi:hypothetical protein